MTKLATKRIAAAALALAVTGLSLSSFTTVNPGEYVRIQNSLTGNHTWHLTEGLQFRVPILSNVARYKQEGTVVITNQEELCATATSCAPVTLMTFSDSYRVGFQATFRYSMPSTPELLEVMHDKVRSADNLYRTTLMPFSKDIMIHTAGQLRAEDIVQGSQGEYRARVIDQATNGLLQTRREQVLIEAEAANQALKREAGSPVVGKQYQYQVVVLKDANGVPLRKPTSISAYGVSLVPSGFSIIDVHPEDKLRTYMTEKQNLLQERSKLREQQASEREQALTSQLASDRKRIESKGELQRQTDVTRLEGEKQVLYATLSAQKAVVEQEKLAQLALIDKDRELQQAKANEAIQEANYRAAVYEAKAMREKGLAEAAVTSAKYAAIDKDVLALETARDTALALYQSNIKVEMPTIVTSGGTNGTSDSIEHMSSLRVMQMLGKAQ